MKNILADIFGNEQPGKGTVKVEKSRQDRTADIKLAKYLKRKYGGNYIVLSDISPQGIKTPDILLTDKAIFESKNVSSLSSVDSQTKKALSQLDRSNLAKYRTGLDSNKLRKVLVLNLEEGFSIETEVIIKTALHRIDRYSATETSYINYIMIRQKNKAPVFIRASKNPHK